MERLPRQTRGAERQQVLQDCLMGKQRLLKIFVEDEESRVYVVRFYENGKEIIFNNKIMELALEQHQQESERVQQDQASELQQHQPSSPPQQPQESSPPQQQQANSPPQQLKSSSSSGGPSLEQLKKMLMYQLEYYFSKENLAHDFHLMSQMDQDQFVPIVLIANFNQMKRLTKDIQLVTQVLKESSTVEVSDCNLKVRPNHRDWMVKLREIPDNTEQNEIFCMFSALEPKVLETQIQTEKKKPDKIQPKKKTGKEKIEEKKQKLEKEIDSFLESSQQDLKFPHQSLISRRLVHEVAEKRDLLHESVGEGTQRRIVLSKKTGELRTPASGCSPISGDLVKLKEVFADADKNEAAKQAEAFHQSGEEQGILVTEHIKNTPAATQTLQFPSAPSQELPVSVAQVERKPDIIQVKKTADEKNEERKRTFEKQIDCFLESSEHALKFPHQNANNRRIVHSVAEAKGLIHESVGEGIERYILVSKKTIEVQDNGSSTSSKDNIKPKEAFDETVKCVSAKERG